MGAIFFFALPGGGCPNCNTREPFDVLVNITAALRSLRWLSSNRTWALCSATEAPRSDGPTSARLSASVHPKDVALECLVLDDEGEVVPVDQAVGVPAPTLRGPSFASSTFLGCSTPATRRGAYPHSF